MIPRERERERERERFQNRQIKKSDNLSTLLSNISFARKSFKHVLYVKIDFHASRFHLKEIVSLLRGTKIN